MLCVSFSIFISERLYCKSSILLEVIVYLLIYVEVYTEVNIFVTYYDSEKEQTRSKACGQQTRTRNSERPAP